jgi:phosphatidylglycerol:prolipoprotein diacylglycerol transferase
MFTYPAIDPVALSLGPIKIHWYGLMYLVGFVGGWWLGRVRARRPDSGWTVEQVDDLLFYVALGVILGGRLGYILFYDLGGIIDDPVRLLRIWEGGMSFHGGLIGVLVAMALFARRHGQGFFWIADFVAPLVTVGLFAGRIGNFINAELWGGPAGGSLGVRVPCHLAPDLCARVGTAADGLYSVPVHATQLYEAGLEGIVLFAILWTYSARPRPPMAVSGLFLLCYGLFRFGVEFVRMPDAHIGYLAFDWFTMGQLLTLPMILFGLILLAMAYSRKT